MKYFFDKNRAQSWSSFSSWWWDKEAWFQERVIHAECTKEPTPFCIVIGAFSEICPKLKVSKEMVFGKDFAKLIEDGNCPVPELMRHLTGRKEHPFNVMFGKIPLVGYADDFDDVEFRRLEEVKTGKKPWNQKRVDQHGQIDMYLLMNYITNKIQPEDVACRLHWLPTQENGDFTISFIEPVAKHMKTFPTKRTMRQILDFGAKINQAYRDMEAFVKAHA